jgi:hypothetical protein
VVVADLDEAAVHREARLAAVGEDQAYRCHRQRAEERRVIRQKRDLAPARGPRDDHVGFALVQHLLR